jgi:hypothetical protein
MKARSSLRQAAVATQIEKKHEYLIAAFESVQTSYIPGVLQVVHGKLGHKSRGKE